MGYAPREMADDQQLEAIREALKAADEALVDALEARAKATAELLAYRAREPEAYFTLPSTAEIVNAGVERAVSFPRAPLERVLREVFGACASMLAPVRVAVVSAGGFGSVAATRHFGSSVELQGLGSIAEVFESVARERTTFGLVPFETSSDGAVSATINGLAEGDARICSEITIGCSYDLLSRTGNGADIENIYGTPEALSSCAATIARDFPGVMTLDVKNAAVAQSFAREDHGAAAVVTGWSEHDGGDLRRARAAIEDESGVDTRFVVIGHERPRRTGRDRTILALAVHDDPGSLHLALQPFAKSGINLTRIESRPARGRSWRYLFIVELDGHMTDRPVLTTVEEVRSASRHLKVLGSFPRPA